MASPHEAEGLLRARGWWLPDAALPLLAAQAWIPLGNGAVSVPEVEAEDIPAILAVLARAQAPPPLLRMAALGALAGTDRAGLLRHLEVLHGLHGPETADHLDAVLAALTAPPPPLPEGEEDRPLYVHLADEAVDAAVGRLAGAIAAGRPLLLHAAPEHAGLLPVLLARLHGMAPDLAARTGFVNQSPEGGPRPDLVLRHRPEVAVAPPDRPLDQLAAALAERLPPPGPGEPRRVVLVPGFPERAMGLALAWLARVPSAPGPADPVTSAWLAALAPWTAEGLAAVLRPQPGGPAAAVLARRRLHPAPRPGVVEFVPVAGLEAAEGLLPAGGVPVPLAG